REETNANESSVIGRSHQVPERRSPMSVRHRSANGGRTRVRAAVPVLIVVSLASLSGAQIAHADPPPPAQTMTAAQARGSGSAVSVIKHSEPGGRVLELQVPLPRISAVGLPTSEQGRRAAARY